MDDREQRLREIAYSLWEEEGYPEGQAERHWQVAVALVGSEDPDKDGAEGEAPDEPIEFPQDPPREIAKRKQTTARGR